MINEALELLMHRNATLTEDALRGYISELDKKKPVVSYTVWQSEMQEMDFEKYHTGVSYNLSASDKKEAEELLLRCRRK